MLLNVSAMNPTDIIRYLETLTVTQGRRSGELLEVLPWQSRFVRRSFRAGVQRAALSVARKNGKTTLVAGLGAASLNGPLVFPRGETLIVASSFEQGRIAFEHVTGFMGDALEDRSKYRVWDTAQQARIEDKETKARVRIIGSDPRRAHGLAPSLCLLDEPAQWPPTTAERMLAALTTAMGAHPFSLMIALGTQPEDPEHWFSKWLHGGRADYAQIHAARPNDPPFQRRTWKRANPSIDALPDLEAMVKAEAVLAKQDPSELASFKALRLNLGTSDTLQNVLLEAGTWAKIEGDAIPTGKSYWGCDLGTSAAQSAIASYWPSTGRLDVLSAFPREPDLATRGLHDGVGSLYTQAARRGELIQTGGAATSIPELLEAALERFGMPSGIAADRWREAELRDSLRLAGFPLTSLELRGMGFKDGGEDTREFRRACVEGKVTPTRSLVMVSAMSEARVVTDPAGNSKLAKGTEGGRRLRARDDAVAASILAVSLGLRRHKTRKRRGRYLGLATA